MDKPGGLQVCEAFCTTEVYRDTNSHSTFEINATSEFCDTNDLSIYDDKEDDEDDIDDYNDQVFSLRGDRSMCDTDASVPSEANQTKGTTLVSSIQSHPNQEYQDSRSSAKTQLAHLMERNGNIDRDQKASLCRMLTRYLRFMSTKPGKCNLFKYKFQVENLRPMAAYNRPIPFSVRPAVRAQIAQMIEEDILETSYSPYLNPLTIVNREGKKPRICVDARRINQFTIPDYERTAPLQELLQRFEGVSYMSSIDLNLAYLQVELDEESRKYTAFLFNSTVYQFKRVPYGFKNSLSAFVRALELALGNDYDAYVVFYSDDILVYSKTFQDHLVHLDTVISRLTEAGFTLNIAKCHFCLDEVKFLGHRIDKTGVSADPQRIEVILHYPAPRNCKQLRQFLGTCNFHSRFIVGYANFVAPLLPLLKQGTKWEWTTENKKLS
jgi:hypothetical protein